MNENLKKLKEIIEKRVFVLNKDEQISFLTQPDAWIFDFRRILMNGKVANLVSDIFYEQFHKKYPFQLGALEIAGVPLVTSLMTKFYYKGTEDINAFFIRKSRKKTGLLRMIEGTLEEEKRIILVDDILNSGDSFWRQIEVLEKLGYKVDTVWSILRFRDLDYYTRFHQRGIKIESLFTLDDFTDTLGEKVALIKPAPAEPTPMPFTPVWQFSSKNPSYGHVVSKSQPILDDSKVYVGSDDRTFWAINQTDGSVSWHYKVGLPTLKKSISSSPALFKNLVIFGAYDGNIYALDKETGKNVWTSLHADWVRSSPAVSADLGIVFVGLGFGLFCKRGGIIALDAHTGKTIWLDASHPAYTHASPLYIEKTQQVAIGSNDGKMRLYDAKKGKLAWEFITDGGIAYDPHQNSKSVSADIREGVVFSSKHDYLIFGSVDTNLYILKRKTGELVHKHSCDFGLYSTPHIYKDKVYFTSLDKTLRCIDLNTLELVFKVNVDNTRLFGSPVVIEDKLYVGTNAGRLHELDPYTGKQLGYFQALERITNTVVFNATTKKYFLPTYANELICLERHL